MPRNTVPSRRSVGPGSQQPEVAGWIWRGTNVAKDLIDWDDEFTEDGLNGRAQVRRG